MAPFFSSLRFAPARRAAIAFSPVWLRRFAPVLAVLLALALAGGARADGPAAYVVFDATTGHVLDASGTEKKAQVGSLTKIATAMVALDWAKVSKADLNMVVPISPDGIALPSANPIGWQIGDAASLRDLLYAALMQSDNVAAQTIAEYVGSQLGGSESPMVRFVVQMNALGRQLGMKRTMFLNPHGLDTMERKLPFSTAGDMGRLARYAMNESAFRFYVSQKQRQITILRGPARVSYALQNTNELLGIQAIDGVKTGTTRLAGECLIVSAARSPESRHVGPTVIVTPRRLIVVLLDSPQRFQTANGLLQRGWQLYDEWAGKGRPNSPKSSL